MKLTAGEKIFDVFNILFLGLLALVMLYPLWNVLMTSLVTEKEYYARPFILWPKEISFLSYRFILSTQQFFNAFKVTALITVVGTLYSMFLTVTLAYGLSRPKLPGRVFFISLIVVTMYFGGGLIPFYLLIKDLHLMNTLAAVIIPNGVGTFYILILMTFFSQIPKELEESAKIDGANEVTILFKIVLPLSLPPIAAISLFYAVERWNEWYNVLLFISDERLYTLQILLRRFIVQNVESAGNEMLKVYQDSVGLGKESLFTEGIKMATVIVATVPILIVYPFLQKHFSQGVMIGSVKE